MRIEATDNGFIQRSATALLIVTVNRNFRTPEFDPRSRNLAVTIPEDQELGLDIETISGTDSDAQEPNNVVNYKFLPSSAGQDYFEVNTESGGVYVKKDLRSDPQRRSSFTVAPNFCFTASDRLVF